MVGRIGLAQLACGTLSIALAANADFSAWKYIPLERKSADGIWSPPHLKSKDFQDTRFQYRWKSERLIDTSVCTVEIRPTDDIGDGEALPELNIVYYDPSGLITGHFRVPSTHDVSVGKTAHAVLKPPDCRRVDFVYWRK